MVCSHHINQTLIDTCPQRFLVLFLPQWRTHDPFRAVEILLVQRRVEYQVLDTGFHIHLLISFRSLAHSIQSAFAGKVHDITFTTGVEKHVGKTCRRFGFRHFRLRQIVVNRRTIPGCPVLGNERINHVAIGGVHRHHATMFFHHLHQLHHLAVVDHQRTFVGHKGFERRNTFFFNHFYHLSSRLLIKIGDRHMITVIADGLAGRFLLPDAQCIVQGIALGLQNKIDDHGGAAEQGRAGARFVIIARKRAHKRHVEVHVRVDAARYNDFAGGVDDFFGFVRKVGTNGDNLFPFYVNVGLKFFRRIGNETVFNENGHT